MLFTWRGGFGQQFLSDYYTYLGNPFSWLAVLVPRAHVDLAVFAVTPITMGAAAAVMTVYLGKLHPGPWWQRGVLGACYGLCGWALSDASYIPMWLWGLVALPSSASPSSGAWRSAAGRGWRCSSRSPGSATSTPR